MILAFLSVPGVWEFLILIVVFLFFLGPLFLSFVIVLIRGKEYREPPDAIRIGGRRKRK